jgi:D-lactate dehydrogenase
MKKEVSELLKCANKHLFPLLSGGRYQFVGSGHQRLHIDCCPEKNWEKYTVSPDATQITLQPGIIGQRVNEILKPYGRKIFAPIRLRSKCHGRWHRHEQCIGHELRHHANSDKVLHSARMVFADATILNTGDAESRRNFTLQEARVHSPDRIHARFGRNDHQLAEKEFAINTPSKCKRD